MAEPRPELTPAELPGVEALRRRTMILRSETRHRRRRVLHVPHNPHRPQSGYSDSHGDGHPDRAAYLPAHTGCEPVSEPPADDVATGGPADPEEVA